MPKKYFYILIFSLIFVVVAGLVGYGYNKASQSTNEEEVRDKNETGEPVIEVEPRSYNFGEVIYGKIAEHIFTIKNLGNQPLEIKLLSTSCGCTKAIVAENDRVIMPGGNVPMLVTFDPAVHQDDHDLGEVKRIIYIKTNDAENPEIEVEITANVIKKESDSNNSSESQTKKEFQKTPNSSEITQEEETTEKNSPIIKTFAITARQWSFSPDAIRVNEGDLIKLEISSLDVTHGFSLPDFNISEKIEPGKKISIEFEANKKGTFNFFCHIPCGSGHSRMKGVLIVE